MKPRKQAEAEEFAAQAAGISRGRRRAEHPVDRDGGRTSRGGRRGPAGNSVENAAPQQPFNARVRNDFRARMQHPRRGGRDRGTARRSRPASATWSTWSTRRRTQSRARAGSPSPAAAGSAPAVDRGHAQAGPGNHRSDREGAAGQEGRAHHEPRRAAGAFSGLYADARPHRRFAEDRVGGRPRAAAPSGERSQGQRGRRVHRAHGGGQRGAGRGSRGRGIPDAHVGRKSRRARNSARRRRFCTAT